MDTPWTRDIIKDPEFDKQDEGTRFEVAKNYFDTHIDTDEFKLQPKEVQDEVKQNFFNTLQRKTPFSGRGEAENITSAAFKTVMTLPKSVTEVAQEGWEGAFGWAGKLGEKAADFVIDKTIGKQTPYGSRPDGTEKGPGFLGEIQRSDGKVMTELSVDVDVTVDGKDEKRYLPLLVPTLDESEIEYLKQGNSPTRPILEKAFAHAQKRWKQGKSAFATDEDRTVLSRLVQKYEKAFQANVGDEIAETPEFAKTLAHMAGAFLPISQVAKGVELLSLAAAAKYGIPKAVTSVAGWATGGAAYDTAVRLAEGEKVSLKDAAVTGGVWGFLDGVAQYGGYRARLAKAAWRLAKATKTDLPTSMRIIENIAANEGLVKAGDAANDFARYAESELPKLRRREAIARIAKDKGIDVDDLPYAGTFEATGGTKQILSREEQLDELAMQRFETTYANLSPEAKAVIDKRVQAFNPDPFAWEPSEASTSFVTKVLDKVEQTIESGSARGTYQQLIDRLTNDAIASHTKEYLETQQVAGMTTSRPTELAGSKLSSQESQALHNAIIEIQQKPMFLWTAEDKVFMRDFLQMEKDAKPPAGFQRRPEPTDILPEAESPVDTIAEAAKNREPEKSIFVPLSGMGARTAEAEAGLKKAKRKPRSDKGVPKKRVEIADDLKDVEAFKAEGEHFGTPFVRMKPRNGEQFPIPIFKDPVTGIEFEKSSAETLSQALKRGREEAGVNGKQPKRKSGENKRYPALEIDGEIYVASLPDGTNHGMVWDSLPEKIIEKAKKVTSGWANKDGSNFMKTHAGVPGGLAGADIDDEGNFTYDPYLGAAGLFAGMGFSKYALRNKLKPTPKRAANTGGKIASMYDETEKMIAEIEKRTFGSLWQKTQHAMFDTGWYSKNLARKVDKKLGMELAEFKSALGGATSRAVEQFKQWNKTIWGDMSAVEERILDRVINAERAFTIDEYKINVTHQRGFTGREFKEDYLNHLQEIEGLNDKQVLKIMDAANKFFEAEHEQLKQLLEAKVISKKDYEHLSKYRYAPRYYIDYMATIEHGLSGRTLTLTETGIKDLESGATGLQDIRARRLLHYNIIKTQDTIAKARANGALLRLTDHIAERGGTIPSFLQFIRRAKVIGMENGKPKYEKPGRNQFTISTVVDGQRIDMIADKEFADSWLGSDPEIARIGTEFIRFCSGSQVVKTFATGINPSFIISNLPMDIGTVLTGGQYSWFLPYAGAQIAKDIAVVAKDAILRKGRFKEYIDEYGGMEFLSLYGRVGKEGGFWSKFEQIAGYPGLTSELMVRLAHRERALANYTKQFKKKHGRAPAGEELKNLQFRATQFARTRGPDYAQHGMLAKILDSGIPYFNANMQAGRVIAQNMKDHPGLFAGHMIQLAGLSALIYAYNKSINPEAVRQISPYDRAMYWTICLPDMPGLTSYTNRNNEKIHRYLRIRKVPALAALVSPVEALIRYVDTGDIPDKTLFAALEGQIPPHALPFFSALAAIAGNKDDFFWNDIWRGAQNIPGKDKYYPGETHPTFVKMGEALAELGIDEYNSPAQLQAAFHKLFSSSNPFVYGTLNGTDAVLELAGNAGIEPAKKTLNELLKNDPTWRRVFGETSPRNTNENRRFEEIDQEEGGIATRIRLEMDELTKDYIQDRTRENIERIRDFILKQHPLVQERLERRFMEAYELRDLPNLPFWLGIKRSLPVARARKLYEHVKNLPSKERPAFIKLANSVPGVVTEDVIQVWNELIADDSPTQ